MSIHNRADVLAVETAATQTRSQPLVGLRSAITRGFETQEGGFSASVAVNLFAKPQVTLAPVGRGTDNGTAYVRVREGNSQQPGGMGFNQHS